MWVSGSDYLSNPKFDSEYLKTVLSSELWAPRKNFELSRWPLSNDNLGLTDGGLSNIRWVSDEDDDGAHDSVVTKMDNSEKFVFVCIDSSEIQTNKVPEHLNAD